MLPNYDYCCVCVRKTVQLVAVQELGRNNQTYKQNLEIFVPEINWQENFKICKDSCVDELDSVISFRNLCFKGDSFRSEQIDFLKQELVKDEEIQSDSDDKCLADYIMPASNNEYFDIDDKSELLTVIKEEREAKKLATPRKKRKSKTVFSCEDCDNATYDSVSKFIVHCTEYHKMDPKDVKPYVCKLCGKKFYKSCNLIKHMIYHEGNRVHMCSYCGKGFITKCDLKIHEMVHENKRENECDACGKRFNTYKDVRSHKLIVHADKSTWKYVCNVCGKRFPIKSNFDTHMKRHVGVKNHVCHICGKPFIDKFVLRRHLISHSNVRAYKCAHCDKDYKYERILKVHMKKEHDIGDIKVPVREKKFFCHVCPKSYYAKDKLQRHLYTHSGEKPFFCTVCDKRFIDKSYVKQHMKTSHNMQFTNDNGF